MESKRKRRQRKGGAAKPPEQKNVINMVCFGNDVAGRPVYTATIGDPEGIEVVVAGRPDHWHLFGIKGFGVGFPGNGGNELSKGSIYALNKAVEEGNYEFRKEVEDSAQND